MDSYANDSPQKLARHNSSLFGTIKNIVIAPLNWLSGTEHDSAHSKGKRRRRQQPNPEDTTPDDGECSPRSKRIRVHSPSRNNHQPSYLDPPESAYQLPPLKRRTPAPLARSSSSAYNLDEPRNAKFNSSRATLSPLRLARTMSIDPPLRPLSRETSLQDVIMDSLPFTLTREHSMPVALLASRPSFRMRSSLTREVSEPPPLNTLRSNPTFVHAPTLQQEPPSASTLGNLVNAVRSIQSPHRQHSSLLFGSSSRVESKDVRPQQVPGEKALQELDIYKTPLVPTRLRSTKQPSLMATSGIPDMFRPRRSPNLLLMHNDRRSEKLGQKVKGSSKSPLANETKPYAGEGGMKKLLARRKQEVEVQVKGGKVSTEYRDDRNDEAPIAHLPPRNHLPTLLPSNDWFAAAAAGTSTITSTSSLRVGRTKTSRSHIARPSARPSGHKFSAVFDEENEDLMDPDDEEARRKEHELLDEATRKAPVFSVPPGFTFEKPETNAVDPDLTDAKELPIAALPFSFLKSAAIPDGSKSSSTGSLFESSAMKFNEITKFSRSLANAPPSFSLESTSEHKDSMIAPSVPSTVPDFFPKSSIVPKTIEIPTPPSLTFLGIAASSPHSASFSTISTAAPPKFVNDNDNPFWDDVTQLKGTTAPEENLNETSAASTAFSDSSGAVSAPSTSSLAASPAPLSIHQPESKPAASSALKVPFGESSGFTFALPPSPSSTIQASKPAQYLESDHSSSTTPNESKSAKSFFENVTMPLLEGETKQATLAAHQISTGFNNFFGEGPRPTNVLGDATHNSIPSPSVFFFDRSAKNPGKEPSKASTSMDLVGRPKPDGNMFSFTTKNKDSESSSNQTASALSFSFGTMPTTPPTNTEGIKTTFNFSGSALTSSSASPTFSFSGGGTNATDVSSKPFPFGMPISVAPTDRPTTPPKNNDQEFRMEESPTREMQSINGNNKPPSLNFPFATPSDPTPTALTFGTSPQRPSFLPSTTQFAFNPATNANPFAATKSANEGEPFSFPMSDGISTATSTSATPFAFSPSKSTASSDAPRPSTTGSFAFNSSATPTSATGPSPFSFSSSAATSNPFGQGHSGSAPSSPSAFNQPSPFAFTAPLPASNIPFSFGSQPASPAGANTTLPSAGGFGVANGGFGQVASTSPFTVPGAIAPSNSSGGTLFTIGAAPAPPAVAGSRQIRKLPNRRPGAKR